MTEQKKPYDEPDYDDMTAIQAIFILTFALALITGLIGLLGWILT